MTKMGTLSMVNKIDVSFFILQVKDNIIGMDTYKSTELGHFIW